MVNPELLREVATEHLNWAHLEPIPIVLLSRSLAGLPGGRALREAGIESLGLDWREIDFLARS